MPDHRESEGQTRDRLREGWIENNSLMKQKAKATLSVNKVLCHNTVQLKPHGITMRDS